MKKNKRIFLIAFITIITIFSSINFANINISYANEETSLLNISECSASFMANYFEESKEIRENDNKENILIVTSETKIKDGEGASKIVAAPNNQYILQYDSEEEKDEALESFKENKKIISVEENIVHTFSATDYNSWGIEKTGLDQAIEVANSKGLKDVTVAIIDSGCDMDLFNQNYPGKIVETYNVYDDKEMYDNFGHGTHIAGTIAEGTPDNVKILPIKVSDGRDLYNTDIIEAINYIVYNDKADVINMSFGTYIYSEAEYQAVEAANKENIICVAAAGNENTSKESYPAAFNNTISISSVNSNLYKAGRSNYGTTITFSAPGENIVSINGTASGTSMAAPHAVSAVAILKSYNKNLTLDNTIELLKKYAIDLGEDGYDVYNGYGFINFNGAEFYDGSNGDKYNVFKENGSATLPITKIEIIETASPTYNYGNITNLMNTNINLYYTETDYYTKQLWQLDNVEIIGYEPYSYTVQTVTIKYKELEIQIQVDNTSATTSGWEYVMLEDNKISITNFKYSNYPQPPKKVYIPQYMDGYTVTEIGEKAFENLDTVKIVIIPDNVIKINKAAFYGCYDLEEVVLSENLIEIDKEAFRVCGDLLKADLPNNLTRIGEGAFKGCAKLMEINLPDSLINLEKEAFYGCSSLLEVTIPQSITVLNNYTVANCSSLKKVNLPSTMTEIKDNAFLGCTSLKEVNLPNSLVSIGKSAFKECSELESIILPQNITKIEKETFRDCLKLSKVELPEKLNNICTYAFSGCISLENIEFPEDLEIVGAVAFGYCESLKKIIIPKKLTNIGNSAFARCTGLEEIIVDDENTKYDSRNNCNALIETDTDTLLCGSANTEVPSTVKIIYGVSFYGNKKLTKLIIHEGVEEIGYCSFGECYGLKNLVIPQSVKIIDNVAFSMCEDITLWVHKDSYAETFAKERNLNYKSIELNVLTDKSEYKAFESVDTNGMYISVSYDDGSTEKIEQGISIKYTGENTSFRGGDTYFTVGGYNQLGLYMEKRVDVTVTKILPTPSIPAPETLYGNLWDSLSAVELPKGYEWMDDKTHTFKEKGEFVYKIKYVPEDTESYEIIENIEVTVIVTDAIRTEWVVILPKKEYKPFEKVDLNDVKVIIKYKGGKEDDITENLKIEYGNGLDSFRYSENGLESVYVSGYGSDGQHFKFHVNVTVTKITPEYTVPTGITAKVGQKLSEIVLPEGFSWMDSSQVIKEAGNVVYKARYTPSDTNNYEIVENIDIAINANRIEVKIPIKVEKTYIYNGSDQYLLLMNFDESKMKIIGNVRKDAGEQKVIVSLLNENYVWEDGTTKDITFTFKIEKSNPNYANSSDYVGVYDGNTHSINLNVNTTDYNIKYSVNNKNYDLNTIPTFKDIGEYTVNYKITKNNYNDVIGTNKVCIYGVEKLDSTLELRNNILVIKNYNNSFQDICNRIKLFAPSYTYNHYDKNKVLTNNVIANTGDSIKININNLKEYEYAISILGDVNGDGKISALDYVKIKNHIMKTNLISSDVYLISADVNDDGKISALDYVRIKNRIMNGGV